MDVIWLVVLLVVLLAVTLFFLRRLYRRVDELRGRIDNAPRKVLHIP